MRSVKGEVTPACAPALPLAGDRAPAAAPLRVAVVGARRVRSGTGPFLALHAARAGAEVRGVIGTTPETAAAARDALAAHEVAARAACSVEPLLEEGLDALIVASPAGTHGPWLDAALRHGLHVLCEKPLLAGPAGGPQALAAGGAAARRLAADFARGGQVLAEACQWPWTLVAFRVLHSSFDLAGARRFAMRLAPPRGGAAGWIESLSHPLSLLQAVVPGAAAVEEIRFRQAGPEERLEFDWVAAGRRVACAITLCPARAVPRAAEYAWDGRLCRRSVVEPGYRFFFDDGRWDGRRVPAEDPMRRLVEAFLARVRARAPQSPDEALVRRQELLAQLLSAWEARR